MPEKVTLRVQKEMIVLTREELREIKEITAQLRMSSIAPIGSHQKLYICITKIAQEAYRMGKEEAE